MGTVPAEPPVLRVSLYLSDVEGMAGVLVCIYGPDLGVWRMCMDEIMPCIYGFIKFA
jgi:hypothetical protein